MTDNKTLPEQNTILYHITLDQAQTLCEHFNVDMEELEDYEICELLDRVIDEEL